MHCSLTGLHCSPAEFEPVATDLMLAVACFCFWLTFWSSPFSLVEFLQEWMAAEAVPQRLLCHFVFCHAVDMVAVELLEHALRTEICFG